MLTTYALLDERHVEDTRFLRRRLGTPYFKRRDSIVRAEGLGSVLRDDAGLWRMWYARNAARNPKTDVVSMDCLESYATSRDGLHWDFPRLGLVEEKGSRDNNIVLGHHQRDARGRYLTGYGGPSGFCVVDAETHPHPAARGRFTAMFHASATDTYGGICLAHSEDGLVWTGYAENPVLPGSQDTQNCFLFDPRLRKYVCFGRPDIYCGREYHANRKIGRWESDDLVRWSPSRVVLDTDERDADAHDAFVEPGMGGWVRGRSKQFQGITPFPLHGLYVGLTWFYDVRRADFTTEMVRSFDGVDWKREALREPLIADGRPEGFRGKLIVPMGSPPVLQGDEHYLYTSATPHDHHSVAGKEYDQDRSEIDAMLENWDLYALALKRDRWAGYEAGELDAELLTTPFAFAGGSPLGVNAAIAEGGYVNVEVEDRWGRPIRELHLDEIEPLSGPLDATDAPVLFGPGPKSVWKLPPATGAGAESAIRLRFRLRRATLYGWSTGGAPPVLAGRDRW